MIKFYFCNLQWVGIVFGLMIQIASAQEGNVYHVDQNIGDDGFQGSLYAPFRTIQRCAREVGPGDTCIVYQGVYRETIKPKRNGHHDAPIRFVTAPGEHVRVTGLDAVSSPWELHKGTIFKTTVTSKVMQLFVEDDLMTIARHPNSSNPFNPVFFTINEASCQVYDTKKWTKETQSCMPHDEDGLCSNSNSCWDRSFPKKTWKLSSNAPSLKAEWAGATLAVINKGEYSAERAVILPNNGQQIISYEWFAEKKMEPGVKFYLSNALAAIDTDKEWFYNEATKTLFFDPPDHRMHEMAYVKTRELAFDLRNKNYIIVEGFDVFAASIDMGPKSEGVVLNRLNVQYPVHHQMFGATQNFPGQGANRHKVNAKTMGKGLTLGGKGNVLKNSIVAHSWCDGVTVYGENNTVENNMISDVNWGMTACSAVTTNGLSHKVIQNTLFDCGRSCLWHQMTFEAEFAYNEIYNACKLGLDCGVVGSYGWYGEKKSFSSDANGDGTGSIYHHNWIHNNENRDGGPCLYLDNNEQDYLLHHNVLWNCSTAFVLNDTFIAHGETGHRVLNNTCFNVDFRISDFGQSNKWQLSGVEFNNNLCVTSRDEHYNPYSSASVRISHNIGPGIPNAYADHGNREHRWKLEDLLLQDPDNNIFIPMASSPSVNSGMDIPGITVDVIGQPDVGAYEYGFQGIRAVGFQSGF